MAVEVSITRKCLIFIECTEAEAAEAAEYLSGKKGIGMMLMQLKCEIENDQGKDTE